MPADGTARLRETAVRGRIGLFRGGVASAALSRGANILAEKTSSAASKAAAVAAEKAAAGKEAAGKAAVATKEAAEKSGAGKEAMSALGMLKYSFTLASVGFECLSCVAIIFATLNS